MSTISCVLRSSISVPALFLALVLCTSSLIAAVPTAINYQGYLTDSNRVPVGSGVTANVSVVFSLYPTASGGAALWSSTQAVSVSEGFFTTELNVGTALPPLNFAVDYYLGIKVGADAEMTPRQKLLSAPYAFRAEAANSVAAGSIQTASIADGAITSAKIQDQSISFRDIADGAVGGTQIADGSINSAKISTSAVGSAQIADGAVTAAKLANGAVGSSQIADGAVNAAKISAGAVGSTQIATAAITSAKIGAGAVGTSALADSAVTAAKIALPLALNANLPGTGTIAATNPNTTGRGLSGSAAGDYGTGIYGEGLGDHGRGVYSTASGIYGTGVYGDATNTADSKNYGGYFLAKGNTGEGVHGEATGNAGNGVRGKASGSTGVGVYGEGGFIGGYFLASSTGVEGASTGSNGDGVHGFSSGSSGNGVSGRATGNEGIGVFGHASDLSDAIHYGGFFSSSGNYGRGVYGNASGTNAYAGYFVGNVHIAGALSATSKSFIQPHPTDPSKEIVYVSLEGGENGVYVRGSGQLKDGKAEINLPAHFVLVAAEQGLTVQITALDESNGLFVPEKTPSRIIVQETQSGRSNARFDYLVNGLRRGYEKHEVIRENTHVQPTKEMSQQEYEEWLALPKNNPTRTLLIENGTLTAEGKIHPATAERLGWKLGPKTKAERMQEMDPKSARRPANSGPQ